jgi:hypothetical protein
MSGQKFLNLPRSLKGSSSYLRNKLSNEAGGTMKTLICVTAIWVVFFIAGASLAQSETQVLEGYTFMRSPTGPQVCLGRWVPPRDVAFPGVCEGQMVDVSQLTAVSARLSADRLDQILRALGSIDEKLAVNNDRVEQLIEATAANTQTSIDQQVRQVSELLTEVITKRFDALPEEILTTDLFKEELTKLREDILREVAKRYSTSPTPSTK